MSEVDEARLGDVAQMVTGYPFKSSDYVSDPHAPRLLRGDNIGQGYIRWRNVQHWPWSLTDNLEQYWLRAGDVVIAMDRPWIEAGLKYATLYPSDLPALLVQRVARLRGSSDLDSRFLQYVIGSRDFTQYVIGVQTGTTVPHISEQQIADFRFPLPRLVDQQRIAEALGVLDDKIELNRRMNYTLEEMARAIYKDWFVDFGPVRAKIEDREPYLSREVWGLFPDGFDEHEKPNGWEISTIGNEVNVVGGSTPSTKQPRYWGGENAWATPKDLAALRTPVLLETSRTITDEGVKQISSRQLPPDTVLLSSRAPVGYLAISQIPVSVNQGFIAMKCQRRLSSVFVWLWAHNNLESMLRSANGSTFQEISKRNFRPLPILVPTEEIRCQFETLARPLFDRIARNERENASLAEMRDLLLPLLMSGEVTLKDAEKETVEAV